MVDYALRRLRGRCLLVVEDEYLIAADLTASLESVGVEVIGPAGSVKEALTLVENDGGRLDGAVLDINLHACFRLLTHSQNEAYPSSSPLAMTRLQYRTRMPACLAVRSPSIRQTSPDCLRMQP